MPNRESERTITDGPKNEAHNLLAADAYNFCVDSLKHPDARARQAFVTTCGAIVEGIKDLPNELVIALGKRSERWLLLALPVLLLELH
jgi:hypothetical protein